MSELCQGARSFLAKVNLDAWRAVTARRTGVVPELYYGPERSDGSRPRLYREQACRSHGIRLAGPADLRAAALWVRPTDPAVVTIKPTYLAALLVRDGQWLAAAHVIAWLAARQPKWSCEGAWFWLRHDERDVARVYPLPLGVTDLQVIVGIRWGLPARSTKAKRRKAAT